MHQDPFFMFGVGWGVGGFFAHLRFVHFDCTNLMCTVYTVTDRVRFGGKILPAPALQNRLSNLNRAMQPPLTWSALRSKRVTFKWSNCFPPSVGLSVHWPNEFAHVEICRLPQSVHPTLKCWPLVQQSWKSHTWLFYRLPWSCIEIKTSHILWALLTSDPATLLEASTLRTWKIYIYTRTKMWWNIANTLFCKLVSYCTVLVSLTSLSSVSPIFLLHGSHSASKLSWRKTFCYRSALSSPSVSLCSDLFSSPCCVAI